MFTSPKGEAPHAGLYEIVATQARAQQRPAVLVGYSQGGLVARFLAWMDEQLFEPKYRAIAGVVLVRVPDENLIPLESALAKLAPSGLRVSIERGAAAEAEKPARLVALEIVGKERAGIVRDVTKALNALGVNIEEFTSGLEGEPFTGVEMFRATARLSVPEGLKLDELRKALERLAAEIMVDLAVDDGEPGA